MSRLESGTLMRIIERITDPHNTDINIRNAFLLTYHIYSNTNEIIDLLKKRSSLAYDYSQLFYNGVPTGNESSLSSFSFGKESFVGFPSVAVFPNRESFFSVETESVHEGTETTFDINDALSNSVQIRILSTIIAWLRTPYAPEDFKEQGSRVYFY